MHLQAVSPPAVDAGMGGGGTIRSGARLAGPEEPREPNPGRRSFGNLSQEALNTAVTGRRTRQNRPGAERRALTERGPRISAIAQELKNRDSAARQEAGLERLRERDAINNRSARIGGIAQSMRDEANIFDRADESTALAERRAMQERRAVRNSGRREKIAAGREQQQNFRRGAGAAGLGAGAAAVLGGILGLSNMGKEEEQQY